MFQKILYPTDFSEYAEKLAGALDEFIKAGLKEVVLAHIVDFRIARGMAKEFEKQAVKKLTGIKEQLEKKGIKAKVRVRTGIPFVEIVGLARKEKVSMILMGSHGKSLVRQMVLGSTSENMLRYAPVPLLIFRLKMVKESGRPIRFIYREILRKILFPTDFSDCARKALEYAKKLGEAGIKEAVIMHVRDVRIYMPEIMKKLPEKEQTDTQNLKKIRRELEASGIKTKTLLVNGVPFVEINKAAERENASLIVMGSHGRSMVEETFVGSVCGQVVRYATKPVLIIRRNMRK
jgi:nucleotide-binding universal stress UspA family protein